MAAIETVILEEFYKKLDAASEIPEPMLDALRALLAAEGRLRPDDFIQVFAPSSEETIP